MSNHHGLPKQFGRTAVFRPLGNPNILDKLTPHNKQYQSISSKLGTTAGTNINHIKHKINTQYELFHRINRNQLHCIIQQHTQQLESIESLLDHTRLHTGTSTYNNSSSIHTLDNIDINTCQYILLDIREVELYDECHINTAIQFNIHYIKQDKLTQLYSYRNKSNTLIVLYDNQSEVKSIHDVATSLVQKGYDNIYLLTGGIKHYAIKYMYDIVGDTSNIIDPNTNILNNTTNTLRVHTGQSTHSRSNSTTSRLNTGNNRLIVR